MGNGYFDGSRGVSVGYSISCFALSFVGVGWAGTPVNFENSDRFVLPGARSFLMKNRSHPRSTQIRR